MAESGHLENPGLMEVGQISNRGRQGGIKSYVGPLDLEGWQCALLGIG